MDESCPLITVIPTVLLIDPCENCVPFCHKNGRDRHLSFMVSDNWHFSGFSFMVSDNWHFYGFSFMVSDNSTFIFYCPRYPREKPGTSASLIYKSKMSVCLSVHALVVNG